MNWLIIIFVSLPPHAKASMAYSVPAIIIGWVGAQIRFSLLTCTLPQCLVFIGSADMSIRTEIPHKPKKRIVYEESTSESESESEEEQVVVRKSKRRSKAEPHPDVYEHQLNRAFASLFPNYNV